MVIAIPGGQGLFSILQMGFHYADRHRVHLNHHMHAQLDDLNLSSWTWLPALLIWLNLSQMHWLQLVPSMPLDVVWVASGSPSGVILSCGENRSLTTLFNILSL